MGAGEPLIAPCGLDCGECTIWKARGDPVARQRAIDWFREQRGKTLRPEEVRCGGCRGPLTEHWSADCAIRGSCLDQHKLHSCSECPEFACERLEKWAAGGERYAAALARLREMRSAAKEQR